ncbi:hypothetical protein ACFSQD_13715 [Flavihumibacter stibioxidans]|uniref:YD repeat-containing protein n=1 Tax=Flavihumibacter stibioxidans TaxID=1834163 RepID=A0ABR7M8I2_9BACT|nr:hypothetical protein [Flavihumibacter stibioxidans]MBC6491343.1 hypothetical protein [Flavihumibacter stibioxidans]
MKNVFKGMLCLYATTMLFTACKKDDQPVPQTPGPEQYFAIKVKASITIGDIKYDSIPANFKITSWDKNGLKFEKDTLLAPGANLIYLPKSHPNYSIRVSKWGIVYEMPLRNNEVVDGKLYTLGGTRAAKKLSSEKNYVYQDESFRLSKKLTYAYDQQGRLENIRYSYFNPTTSDPEPTLATIDRFVYNENRLEKIEIVNQLDGANDVLGYSRYYYNQENKMIAVQYSYQSQFTMYRNRFAKENGYDLISMDELNDYHAESGSKIELKFSGGNRVEETTIIPSAPTSTRTYDFDAGINPYVHLKWPQMYFKDQSKNNTVAEKLDGTLYLKSEYRYDSDGYPIEVVKQELNPSTGQFRIVMKTVYSY